MRPPRAAALAAVAVIALAASPAAAGGGNKAACDPSTKTTCIWKDQWSKWGEKFNASIFQNASSYMLAESMYLNPAKIEHWIDEWHVEMQCCEFWRCNKATLKCEPPSDSGASALAAPVAAALLASAAALMM
jgi:hypothetical protein